MTPHLATSFMPNLVEQTAICLHTDNAREFAEQSAAARSRFEALWRAHETLLATTGGIGAALAGLADGGDRPAVDGLARALEVFRAQRGGANISWLDLYCTTTDAIETINFRSTKSLVRLSDDQLGVVLAFARQACAFVEINYNRDFEVAGMAVTCDRIVERGVASGADRFRVATLRQRIEDAERDVAENGARWSAAFEGMAAQLEQGFLNRRPMRDAGASADWRGMFSHWWRRPRAGDHGAAAPDCEAASSDE
jgi:hypothetical protein